MRTFTIIYFVLISLIVISCNDNSVESTPDEYEPIIPIDTSYYWLYQGYYLVPEDGEIDFPEHDKFGFIITSLPTKLKNERPSTHYQINICGEDLQPIDDTNIIMFGGSKIVYNDKQGFHYAGIIRNDTLVSLFDDLIFPYPVSKDETVSGHVFFYSPLGNSLNVPDNVTTQYTCVSTDSLFTTPLGNFYCVVYRMIYADYKPLVRSEVTYFIKPNFGIVGTIEKAYHYNTEKYSYFKKYVLIKSNLTLE